MRISLELVVIAIVILVVALVVLTIFSGGINQFQNIFGGTSEDMLKQQQCSSACSFACMGKEDGILSSFDGKYRTGSGVSKLCGGKCNCTNGIGKWEEK